MCFSFKILTQVEVLVLSGNNFSELSPAVYDLTNLKVLDLSDNSKLARFDQRILQLKNLQVLNCSDSSALIFPPYAVCEQGLAAVRKYLLDYISKQGTTLTQVPVSVVGKTLSGKTSVIKSLQSRKRVLTFRDKKSSSDETTTVFNIEELKLPSSIVKILDHGGNEVYHLVYQLVIREQCVPVVVVDIALFSKLTCSNGPREATRRLCFDWLSHLYLACPKLGSPILVLTHTDQLQDKPNQCKEARETLLFTAEAIRKEILEEESRCPSTSKKAFTPVKHLHDTQLPLFDPDEIFEFSNDLHDTSSIERLIERLENRCKEFTTRLPRLWEEVEAFVNQQSDVPFIKQESVIAKFDGSDPQTILQFMHNSGRILWFREAEKLSDYIFHRPAAITDIFALLFHHSADEKWKQRSANFRPFDYKEQRIEKGRFKSLVKEFTGKGVLDEALLSYLFIDYPQFDYEVALALLQHFHILHGPVKHKRRTFYIMPFFSSSFMGNSWKTDKDLQLRIDLEIRGLSIPWYVFQLVTVAVLNDLLTDSSIPDVRKDGLKIQQLQHTIHLVHDFNNGKITLQVSSSANVLERSWTILLTTACTILELILKTWKACHVEVFVYCAHCLFLRDDIPETEIDPYWFHEIYKQKSLAILDSMHPEEDLVPCERGLEYNEDSNPFVPTPLRFPCKCLLTLVFILDQSYYNFDHLIT